MYDRVIRAELYRSDRWLDLPSDTHRLVFVALVNEADDFGNLEGGSKRLCRFMREFTQVKTEADAIKLMNELAEADLVRAYTSNHHDYWHLPRFKNSRTYYARKYPKSPWCDDTLTTVEKKRKQNSNPAPESESNLIQIANKSESSLIQVEDKSEERSRSRRGVGVGVGVGLGLEKVTSVVLSKNSGETLAPSADAPDAAASPTCVEKIPLNDGTQYEVTPEQVAEWDRTYQAVDIVQTLREIRQWNIANPKRRKTRSGIESHIIGWLQKEQNK
jgi:hypothetical protein